MHAIIINLLLTSTLSAQTDRIYTVKTDATGFRQFAPIGVAAKTLKFLAYSRDGKKIAFAAANSQNHMQVFVMNSDGSNTKKITGDGDPDQSSPSFTPDGKKILLTQVQSSGSKNDLYLIDLDGSGKQLVKQDAGFGQFSPDGSKLVFVRVSFPTDQIFICNADGTAESQIAIDSVPSFPSFNPQAPSAILFTGFQHPDQQTIQVIRLDGSGGKVILRQSDTGGQVYSIARYSPDGRTIVYSYAPSQSRKFDVYKIQSDGTGLQRLTNQDGINFFDAAFGPDASTVIFFGTPQPAELRRPH